MKPLKRPMFRSGGPIKEGIMDGMKEPQAINTVGSPLAPTDSSGRQGYALPIIPALIAGARALPTVYRGIRMAGTARAPGTASFFRNLFPTGRFRTVPGKQRSPSPEFIKGDPTAFPGGTGPAKTLGLGEALKNPLLLGKAIRENPFTALTAASALPQTAALAGKGVVGTVKALPDIAKGYIEAVLPGKQFDDKEKTTETDTTGLKKVDSFDEVKKGGESVSQEKKDQITADRIEENRKRYYKLMGIDKMKKGAAYDSLIDASRIIQEQGGDLKGAIRSGTLQNSIIQAISKNLDKSTDIKKQIDAAILKGEIEKDIKSADTMDKRLKEAQIKRLERDEKQNTTAAKIAAVQVDKGAVTGADTAAILRADGIEYTGTLPDDEFLKFKKKNKGKDERDFLIENYGTLDDGKYIVGGRLVEKRGNDVAFAI